VTKIKER